MTGSSRLRTYPPGQRHWTWKKALAVAAGMAGGVIVLAVAGVNLLAWYGGPGYGPGHTFDIIHRVGTQNTMNVAKNFGVNVGNYPAGSGLQSKQATTFATLDNGSMIPIQITHRQVFSGSDPDAVGVDYG